MVAPKSHLLSSTKSSFLMELCYFKEMALWLHIIEFLGILVLCISLSSLKIKIISKVTIKELSLY